VVGDSSVQVLPLLRFALDFCAGQLVDWQASPTGTTGAGPQQPNDQITLRV
jgi:hypothetical protein